jgi:predicted dehydrogenase
VKASKVKNVLVIGTGSIGSRHASNLMRLGCKVAVYSVTGRTIKDLSDIVYEPLLTRRVIKKYDAVVIANETDKHLVTAEMCVRESIPFYIEKPLSNSFSGVKEINELIISKSLVTKVGYMMRAHPNLIFLNNYLKNSDKSIFFVSSSVGQWLEDWRPGTDYRDCYSAHAEQGGGVIYELIHEIDIAYWLFGEVEELFCYKDRVSNLEINTEDFAQIILKSKAGFTIDIKMDYLKTVYKRDLEIVMEGSTLTWDYVMGQVKMYDKSTPDGVIIHQTNPEFVRNSMFVELMKNFLAQLDGDVLSDNNFNDGTYSMMLAVKAHESADGKKWIKV